MPFIKIALILFLIPSLSFPVATEWSLSEDYEVAFAASGAKGTFKGLSGKMVFDPADLSTASFDMQIDVSTISTGNKTKNKHARGKKWFHIEEFPYITLQSTSVNDDENGYELIANLTIRDVTKQIIIPFTFEPDGDDGVFKSSFSVNRKEYGLKGPGLNFTVSDDIEIKLKIPVTKS